MYGVITRLNMQMYMYSIYLGFEAAFLEPIKRDIYFFDIPYFSGRFTLLGHLSNATTSSIVLQTQKP